MSLDKRTKRAAKRRGKYAEERVALRLGGRLTISSGSGILEKGDVHVDDLNLFVEVKYCGVRQGRGDTVVSFDREWLEKTILDAEAAGMLPVIALRFRDGTGAYATTAEVFERLVAQVHHFKKGSDLLDSLLKAFPEETQALLQRLEDIQQRLSAPKEPQ